MWMTLNLCLFAYFSAFMTTLIWSDCRVIWVYDSLNVSGWVKQNFHEQIEMNLSGSLEWSLPVSDSLNKLRFRTSRHEQIEMNLSGPDGLTLLNGTSTSEFLS
jgi:hypothetical protein